MLISGFKGVSDSFSLLVDVMVEVEDASRKAAMCPCRTSNVDLSALIYSESHDDGDPIIGC